MISRRSSDILKEMAQLDLLINKKYSCEELSLEQFNFFKSLDMKLYLNDSVIIECSNLDYIEYLAEKRGLI